MQASAITINSATDSFVAANAHPVMQDSSLVTLTPIRGDGDTWVYHVSGVGSALPGYETRVTIKQPAVDSKGILVREFSIRLYDSSVVSLADIPSTGLPYQDMFFRIRRNINLSESDATAGLHLSEEVALNADLALVLTTQAALF